MKIADGNVGKNGLKTKERIRAYRRYCKEDIEDIAASTKVETTEKKEGKETERNEIGDKKTERLRKELIAKTRDKTRFEETDKA